MTNPVAGNQADCPHTTLARGIIGRDGTVTWHGSTYHATINQMQVTTYCDKCGLRQSVEVIPLDKVEDFIDGGIMSFPEQKPGKKTDNNKKTAESEDGTTIEWSASSSDWEDTTTLVFFDLPLNKIIANGDSTPDPNFGRGKALGDLLRSIYKDIRFGDDQV